MTLFEFQLLTEEEKVSRLYEEGVYIGKRKEQNMVILLYQLEIFYAEIFYRSYRRHVHHIRCSESTGLIDPYLEQIDVLHLVG